MNIMRAGLCINYDAADIFQTMIWLFPNIMQGILEKNFPRVNENYVTCCYIRKIKSL